MIKGGKDSFAGGHFFFVGFFGAGAAGATCLIGAMSMAGLSSSSFTNVSMGCRCSGETLITRSLPSGVTSTVPPVSTVADLIFAGNAGTRRSPVSGHLRMCRYTMLSRRVLVTLLPGVYGPPRVP